MIIFMELKNLYQTLFPTKVAGYSSLKGILTSKKYLELCFKRDIINSKDHKLLYLFCIKKPSYPRRALGFFIKFHVSILQ